MLEGNQAALFAERQQGMLPGELAIEWETVAKDGAVGRFTASRKHMAPNGFMHAASVICLADSACGYACVCALPEGASGFTTLELKTNFLRTAREGRIAVVATNQHAGRTTQVWDAGVTDESTGKTVALFRCTQSVLWPRQM